MSFGMKLPNKNFTTLDVDFTFKVKKRKYAKVVSSLLLKLVQP